jgi:PAS domain S-box-containing protein
VTERKRAEEALRRSEAYLAEAQKLSHTGSCAWNMVTREINHSSAEHSRLYGFDPELGVPSLEAIFQRVHPEDRAAAIATLEKAFRERTDSENDFRAALPDGSIKYIHAVGHPVFDAAGNLVEYVGTAVDVTERKRAEEERERLRQLEADLARMNRVSMMGELAASLAHEIKQPIAAAATNVGTCLRWLQHQPAEIEEAREAAARIAKEVNRAADVINRVRSLYTKGDQQRELLRVNEVIEEMIILLRDEASRYSILIRSDLAKDLPKMIADRVQLQQVFMNLMLNGIEAMKDTTGELTVKSERTADGQILISVSDTGVGLPGDKVQQIFDAFFTTKPQGTGMGLAITRSIIEAHGGRLWTTANAGPGATFHFTLPSEATASSTSAG